MNNAPHLLSEDRPEFERVLDDALHAEDTTIALANAPSHLNPEQLRTLALGATAAIAGCAATEYQHYLEVREQIRAATPSGGRRGSSREESSGVPASAVRDVPAETAGAGLFAVVTVLTPILAGIAAVIFLCVGYALEVVDPEPSIASPLRTAGWLFAAVAGAGLVIGMVALLLTALRNPAADSVSERLERSPEVASAREAWRKALLERGVRPFLHEVLLGSVGGAGTESAVEGPHPPSRGGTEPTPSRTPRLGYSRPGFTSPSLRDPAAPRRGPEYSSPHHSSPRFSSPDFDTGCDQTGA